MTWGKPTILPNQLPAFALLFYSAPHHAKSIQPRKDPRWLRSPFSHRELQGIKANCPHLEALRVNGGSVIVPLCIVSAQGGGATPYLLTALTHLAFTNTKATKRAADPALYGTRPLTINCFAPALKVLDLTGSGDALVDLMPHGHARLQQLVGATVKTGQGWAAVGPKLPALERLGLGVALDAPSEAKRRLDGARRREAPQMSREEWLWEEMRRSANRWRGALRAVELEVHGMRLGFALNALSVWRPVAAQVEEIRITRCRIGDIGQAAAAFTCLHRFQKLQ
jgi:hypothetical protein